MSTTIRFVNAALLSFLFLALGAARAHARPFLLAASGTIAFNSSGDSTIPVGTPWTFELGYDTDAPDLDFELIGSADPTFGRFTNTSAPPALISFHYHAGGYEVSIDDPAGIGSGSEVLITFTTVNAIDVNIHAPGSFPTLNGGAVSFHADFNALSMAPIFTSDGLPTNTDMSRESFDQSAVTLLPPSGEVTGDLESLTLTPLPEPSGAAPLVVGLIALLAVVKRSPRHPRPSRRSTRSATASRGCGIRRAALRAGDDTRPRRESDARTRSGVSCLAPVAHRRNGLDRGPLSRPATAPGAGRHWTARGMSVA